MFSIRTSLCAVLAVGAVMAASSASAISLDMTKYGRINAAKAEAQMSDFLATHTVTNKSVETFDGYSAWDGTSGTSNPQNTNVGRFGVAGTSGSGYSAVNGGGALQVRHDNSMRWGRYNSGTPAKNIVGSNWLDSNDNQTMTWEVKGDGKFNTIAFFLTDIADVGGKFSIKVGETVFSDLAKGKRLKNGTVHLVIITLDEAGDSIMVNLGHDRANDGFGINAAMVANVAPVPLPPAAALLVTGMAAIGGLRYRRRRSVEPAAAG